MARTAKDLETTLYGWPEQGGFQFDSLLELLAELEGRLEALEEENRRLRQDLIGARDRAHEEGWKRGRAEAEEENRRLRDAIDVLESDQERMHDYEAEA